VRQQAWPLLLGIVIGMVGAVPAGDVLQADPFFLDPAEPLVQLA
jgi:hypothetical protein